MLAVAFGGNCRCAARGGGIVTVRRAAVSVFYWRVERSAHLPRKSSFR